MRKKAGIIYIMICLVLCALPFIGMVAVPTDTTTENREMAEFPQIKSEGKWNQKYLQQLGEYFNDHFAFRAALVTADSVIQTKIFGVSNMDKVIAGTDGWLYYQSTLSDYLGTDVMSDREAFNVANNLSIMQQAVENRGAEFLVTVAPNKNTLYGEHMPYYNQKKVDTTKNLELVGQKLADMEVPYADLYAAFSGQKEILYLKKDSHWNEKGAVLAYNTILDALECEHETYETVENVRTKTEYGDLNKMMYPLDFEPEWNYSYQMEHLYTYVTDTESVEDAWIETKNEHGTGSLLMFRDSFGNTLLPYMADVFEKAYFSKSVPYNIETYMNTYSPEYVVVEKVERNLGDFAKRPPVMTAPLAEAVQPDCEESTSTTVEVKECEFDTAYWEISGIVDKAYVQNDTRIFIRISNGEQAVTYEAFTVEGDGAGNGYLMYILKKDLSLAGTQVEVLTENETVQKVAEETISADTVTSEQ